MHETVFEDGENSRVTIPGASFTRTRSRDQCLNKTVDLSRVGWVEVGFTLVSTLEDLSELVEEHCGRVVSVLAVDDKLTQAGVLQCLHCRVALREEHGLLNSIDRVRGHADVSHRECLSGAVSRCGVDRIWQRRVSPGRFLAD